jgi:hypothetical protein
MPDYHNVALKPDTFERLIDFEQDYFGTDSVPNGEAVEALIQEFDGGN